ncbi:MAG: NYN domain-containing protein [Candidatus Heimdallarchaeota archaeon]|nr:NYN domain-containing protein [Candidatus Heimdallarchaeota archaeon]
MKNLAEYSKLTTQWPKYLITNNKQRKDYIVSQRKNPLSFGRCTFSLDNPSIYSYFITDSDISFIPCRNNETKYNIFDLRTLVDYSMVNGYIKTKIGKFISTITKTPSMNYIKVNIQIDNEDITFYILGYKTALIENLKLELEVALETIFERKRGKSYVLWDFENVRLNEDPTYNQVLQGLINQHSPYETMLCFSSRPLSKELTIQITKLGFQIRKVSPGKNAVDIQSILEFTEIISKEGASNVEFLLLIAGDNDYVKFVDFLHSKGIKVQVIANSSSLGNDLKNAIITTSLVELDVEVEKERTKSKNMERISDFKLILEDDDFKQLHNVLFNKSMLFHELLQQIRLKSPDWKKRTNNKGPLDYLMYLKDEFDIIEIINQDNKKKISFTTNYQILLNLSN